MSVEMPTGGIGKRCKFVDLEQFLKEKQCIIQIRNRDELCCARALVTAKARLEKSNSWDNIRRGLKIQTYLAQELHKKAGVPLGICGLEEITKFQNVMEGFQNHVISKDHFNGIIYHGPDAPHKIYIYHHETHYDVITSMPAFLNKNYFCSKCFKGYDKKERHSCNEVCGLCHKIHSSYASNWKHWHDCNRNFKGEVCYELHKKETKTGKSTCKLYYRCKDCLQTINKEMHKKAHTCGERFCKRCQDFYDPGHMCYMTPVLSEIKHVHKDTNKGEIDVDSDNAKYEKPLYIFSTLNVHRKILFNVKKDMF